MIKRAFSVLFMMALLCLPVRAREVTLYSAAGREKTVCSDEAGVWRQKGWHDRDEVYTLIYSYDGQEREVLNIELKTWEDRGWREDPDQLRTVLYSWDGADEKVWNAFVDEKIENGWVRTPEEAQTLLYDASGNRETVWNAEVEDRLANGWYRTEEEAMVRLYDADGASKTVWRAESEALLSQGWSLTPPAPKRERPEASTPADGGPMVALTFDDGPGPYTGRILDCLEKYGAKATFFVVGNRLGTYSAQLKREAELGMEIGCHSWAHSSFTSLGASGTAADIKRTNDRVEELAGVRPVIVRPPYGSHNASVREAAGAPFILWNIDTLDWKTKNADSTYNAVLDKVKDGDIVLMHDIHSPTADAVERIVPALTERGFRLVTVSELAAARGGMSAGKAYSSFR